MAPNSPTPSTGVTLATANPLLSWASNWALSYDVYIGLSPATLVLVSSAQAATFFQTVAQSVDQTTYYWQIIARNTQGTTAGPVWTFTLSLNPDDITDSNTSLIHNPQIQASVDGSQIRNRIYVVSSEAGLAADGSLQGPVSAPEQTNFFAPAVVATSSAMDQKAAGFYPFFFYGLTAVTAIGETDMILAHAAGLQTFGGVNSILLLFSLIADARVLSFNIYRANSASVNSQEPLSDLSLFGKIGSVLNKASVNTSSNFIYNGVTVSNGSLFFGTALIAYLDNSAGNLGGSPSGSAPPKSNNSGITSKIVDDTAAQATLAAQTGGDGVIEALVVYPPVDSSSISAAAQLQAYGNAQLALFSQPIVTVKYSTYDSKSRAGKLININLVSPPIVAKLRIQSVKIDDVGVAQGLAPRYHVVASTLRYTLDDLLRNVLVGTSGLGSVSSSGGSGASIGPGNGSNVPGTVTTVIPPDAVNVVIAYFFPLAGSGSIGYSNAGCPVTDVGTNPVSGDDATRPYMAHTCAASTNNTSGVHANGGFCGIEHNPYYKFIVKTGSVVSVNRFWVGISVSVAVIPTSNCPSNSTFIGFRFSDQAGNVIVNDGVIPNTAGVNPAGGTIAAQGVDTSWLCMVQNTNGSPGTSQQQFLKSGVAIAANTVYTFEISISGTTVTFTINGTVVGTLLTTFTSPGVAFTAFQQWGVGPIGVATAENVAKTLNVGYVYMKRSA